MRGLVPSLEGLCPKPPPPHPNPLPPGEGTEGARQNELDRNFEHPQGARVTISGQLGDDAKPYQEREVRKKIQESKL